MGVKRSIGYGLAGSSILGVGVAAKRLLALDRQRGAYRRAWESHSLATLKWLSDLDRQEGTTGALEDKDQENAEAKNEENTHAQRPFVYVALGDSSVQGIGASSVEESYPARLASAIETAKGQRVALINISLSGATTESVEMGQIPLMRGLGLLDPGNEPDLVTLTIGGNDVMVPQITPSAYSHAIARILDALKGRVLVSTIPSFAPMSQDARAQDMSELLAEEARAHGAGLVDIRALSQSWPLASYAFHYHAADMFHPNTQAYAAWAQEFYNVLAKDAGLRPLDVASAPQWGIGSHRVAESEA